MACQIDIFSRAGRAFVRPGALALAVLVGFTAAPGAAAADCVQQMSRIPVAGPAAAGPAYRAAMLRSRPAAAPAAPVYRANMLRTGPTAGAPRATKAKATGVRKARPVRKASLHRPARKSPAPPRRVAAAPLPAGPIPTPMPVAARELATPRAYALIDTTVCESGPGVPSALDTGVPVLTIEPVPGPGITDDGYIPGTDTETVLPPTIGPEFPDDGGPPTIPLPEGPPPGPPVTTPVPEPATWALMILGFGLLGARLRATSSAGSGSPGRAGRPE